MDRKREEPLNCSRFETCVVQLVSQIPKGFVMTYQQISELAGHPRRARHISGILRRHSELPWHRVISSRGMISLPRGYGYEIQEDLLLSEGVQIGKNGKILLKEVLYRPR